MLHAIVYSYLLRNQFVQLSTAELKDYNIQLFSLFPGFMGGIPSCRK